MEVRKDGLYMNIKTVLIPAILERNISIKNKINKNSSTGLKIIDKQINFSRNSLLANDVKYPKFIREYGL